MNRYSTKQLARILGFEHGLVVSALAKLPRGPKGGIALAEALDALDEQFGLGLQELLESSLNATEIGVDFGKYPAPVTARSHFHYEVQDAWKDGGTKAAADAGASAALFLFSAYDRIGHQLTRLEIDRTLDVIDVMRGRLADFVREQGGTGKEIA